MEYYTVLKKKGIWSFAMTWMNLEDNMLSEINYAQKDRPSRILGKIDTYVDCKIQIHRGWFEGIEEIIKGHKISFRKNNFKRSIGYHGNYR